MNTSKSKWSDLFQFKGHYWFLILIFVGLIISGILGGMVPLRIAQLSKQYSSGDFYGSLTYLTAVFVFIFLNRVIYQLTINRYIFLLIHHVRQLIFTKWVNYYDGKSGQNMGDKYPMGEVMARIMSDTQAIKDLMTSGTFGIFIDLFFVGSCLISFVSLNVISGVVLSLSEILATIGLVWGSKYMRSIFHLVRESKGIISQQLGDLLRGITQTYYIPNGNFASKKGLTGMNLFLNRQLKANFWDSGYYSLAESLYPILLAVMVYVFPHSKITQAALVFVLVDLLQRSINPIKGVAGKIANIQRAYTGIKRMGEFVYDIEENMALPMDPRPVRMGLKELEITVDRFTYQEKQESNRQAFGLKDIHLKFRPGTTVGIIGHSGSGKTTLLNILSGKIWPSEGRVSLHYCDNKNDQYYPSDNPEDILNYIGQIVSISQEGHIFTDTLKFNITMGRKAGDSRFGEFWKRMTANIQYLNEWGIIPEDKLDPSTLSLGQKQLIVGLRACFHKRPIVLLDEISSGLDSQLELALSSVFSLVQENAITVIVAHRLETIIDADILVLMDKGRVIGLGPHHELIESSTFYQEFIGQLRAVPQS